MGSDSTELKWIPSGVNMAINGPYRTQSTASLREFIASMRRGEPHPSSERAAKKAEKILADREAVLEKEPKNPSI